jgi:hypothetical protein
MVFVLKSTKISMGFPLYQEVPSYRHTTSLHFNIPHLLTQFNPIILGHNPTNIIIHINHNVYDIHRTTIIIMDG